MTVPQSKQGKPTVHCRGEWKWINRCSRCTRETFLAEDDLWYCDDGHHADYPLVDVLARPAKRWEGRT